MAALEAPQQVDTKVIIRLPLAVQEVTQEVIVLAVHCLLVQVAALEALLQVVTKVVIADINHRILQHPLPPVLVENITEAVMVLAVHCLEVQVAVQAVTQAALEDQLQVDTKVVMADIIRLPPAVQEVTQEVMVLVVHCLEVQAAAIQD